MIGVDGERFYELPGLPPRIYFDEDAWAWMTGLHALIQEAMQRGAPRQIWRELATLLDNLERDGTHVVVRGHGQLAVYGDRPGLSPVSKGNLRKTGVLAFLGPSSIGPFDFQDAWWAVAYD